MEVVRCLRRRRSSTVRTAQAFTIAPFTRQPARSGAPSTSSTVGSSSTTGKRPAFALKRGTGKTPRHRGIGCPSSEAVPASTRRERKRRGHLHYLPIRGQPRRRNRHVGRQRQDHLYRMLRTGNRHQEDHVQGIEARSDRDAVLNRDVTKSGGWFTSQ